MHPKHQPRVDYCSVLEITEHKTHPLSQKKKWIIENMSSRDCMYLVITIQK